MCDESIISSYEMTDNSDSSQSSGNVGLAFGLTIFAGLSTTVGSAAVYFSSMQNKLFLAGSLGASAGVMIFVSFVEIYQKGYSAFEEFLGSEPKYSPSLLATGFFFIGIFFSWFLDIFVHWLSPDIHGEHEHGDHDDKKVPEIELHHQDNKHKRLSSEDGSLSAQKGADGKDPRVIPLPEAAAAAAAPPAPPVADSGAVSAPQADLQKGNELILSSISPRPKEEPIDEKARLLRVAIVSGLALALHNFPEGLATFVAALADPKLGVGVAVAIAMHNIPEGIVVAIPIYYATGRRGAAFFWSFMSGVSEPIGALIGWLALSSSPSSFGMGTVFAIVAGMMIFISLKELLPAAHRYDPKDKIVSKCLLGGMIVMAASLELFKI